MQANWKLKVIIGEKVPCKHWFCIFTCLLAYPWQPEKTFPVTFSSKERIIVGEGGVLFWWSFYLFKTNKSCEQERHWTNLECNTGLNRLGRCLFLCSCLTTGSFGMAKDKEKALWGQALAISKQCCPWRCTLQNMGCRLARQMLTSENQAKSMKLARASNRRGGDRKVTPIIWNIPQSEVSATLRLWRLDLVLKFCLTLFVSLCPSLCFSLSVSLSKKIEGSYKTKTTTKKQRLCLKTE